MLNVEKQIESLAKKATDAKEAHHAMNFAQAALNVAHAYATWRGAEAVNLAKK